MYRYILRFKGTYVVHSFIGLGPGSQEKMDGILKIWTQQMKLPKAHFVTAGYPPPQRTHMSFQTESAKTGVTDVDSHS